MRLPPDGAARAAIVQETESIRARTRWLSETASVRPDRRPGIGWILETREPSSRGFARAKGWQNKLRYYPTEAEAENAGRLWIETGWTGHGDWPKGLVLTEAQERLLPSAWQRRLARQRSRRPGRPRLTGRPALPGTP